MSILSQLQSDQSQFIQSDIVPTMISKADLINLDKLKNFKIDTNSITPTQLTPTQLTISDQKKAELKKLAEKDQRKRNRKEYWNISKEEWSQATPNLLQAGIDTIPGIVAGILDNDYSNALASFSANAVNPIVDVIGNTQKILQSMSLNKQTIPGQGVKSGESQFAKQGMKIKYMNLFK